jgi:hypothetical protein
MSASSVRRWRTRSRAAGCWDHQLAPGRAAQARLTDLGPPPHGGTRAPSTCDVRRQSLTDMVKSVARARLTDTYCRPATEILLRFVRIVASTPQLDILGRRLASLRIGDDMVKFEPRSLATPVSSCAHEGTLSTVPYPDLALDRGRNPAGRCLRGGRSPGYGGTKVQSCAFLRRRSLRPVGGG